MADRKAAKSKYTADRQIPGAFEGETVTRRRFMTGTAPTRRAPSRPSAFVLPALGFALGPIFEEQRPALAGRRADRTTSPTTRTSRRSITIVAGHRRGRQDDGLRAQVQPGHRHGDRRTSTTSSSRSRRAACTSAARCASSRPPSASSARATAASTTSRGEVAGGPPVRPLDRFYTRVRNGQRRGRPALLRQLRARALLAARSRASRSTASASTSTRRVPPIRKIPGT